jgi:hypothetical protein
VLPESGSDERRGSRVAVRTGIPFQSGHGREADPSPVGQAFLGKAMLTPDLPQPLAVKDGEPAVSEVPVTDGTGRWHGRRRRKRHVTSLDASCALRQVTSPLVSSAVSLSPLRCFSPRREVTCRSGLSCSRSC